MPPLAFRTVATDPDIARLDTALRRLSQDLGDRHAADIPTLKRALTGPLPAAHGLLAFANDALAGAALFSPVFSTVLGAPGVHVSDLWVAPERRGQGTGRALLAETATRARTLWGVRWMSLAVYTHSTDARRFYERLGFAPQTGTTALRADLARLGPPGKDNT